jgi:tRNA(Ile2)-agmatinylcytidine synthase
MTFNSGSYIIVHMLVGIDDTDSTAGMCTTYLAAKLCQALGVTETPRLIRLNPNIPYKTRGNGAVAFKTEDLDAKQTVLSFVEKYSRFEDANTNPGVAFLEDEKRAGMLTGLYLRAVSELVTIRDAEDAAQSAGAEIHKFKNGRGIIGALAAIGFAGDVTYEAIAYRARQSYGKPRRILRQSVIDMDRALQPLVFDNLGPSGRRILITPRGNDPIFCGIRGTTKESVEAAWKMITPQEPIELMQVFETNHATDAHLRSKQISQLHPYDCAILTGQVTSEPKTVPGGHVVFQLTDQTGSIDCAAYKPSGRFKDIIRQLTTGDEVSAYGGIKKYTQTVNLEKIEVKTLYSRSKTIRPICCGKTMTSAGLNKGLKCKKCGKKISQKEIKVSHEVRALVAGIYDVPPGSRRHLSKPVSLNLQNPKSI